MQQISDEQKIGQKLLDKIATKNNENRLTIKDTYFWIWKTVRAEIKG